MPELPTGTVTFLFTDLEGSTRLWEQEPDAMDAALARHDALVRGAIQSTGGQVVKGAGDGFHAVFTTAPAAIESAVLAQRALTEVDWGAAGPLRSRMAMHTGNAALRDDDYFGSAVNRAARLRDIAHGGQIVCSQTTADLARDDLPDGIELVDLGVHHLRDLTRPERVFQVNAAGLESEFAPLRSADATSGNLPPALSSFIGRADDVEQVGRLLTAERVVTLTGVGGVGKTRLALEVARGVADRFRHGVWLCELAKVRDPADVAEAVATVVGAPIVTGEAPADALAEFLVTKQLLLVLDNCEHVLGPVSDLVAKLELACPDLWILATSREGLAVPGERIVAVRSMAMADSIHLFVERAQAKTEFALTAANAASVAEICRRLDGIPLAIELAAGRVAVLAPAELARRLDQRFQLLAGGDRGAVERHATLRAAIDWSYDLLEPSEQLLLARMSVFAGGATLDAVEAVCAGSPIARAVVLDLLASLVARSLVVAETAESGGATSYQLLETIRQYAEERLASEDRDAVRERHARFYAEWASAMVAKVTTPGLPDAYRLLARETENLRVAMRWALGREEAAIATTILSVGPSVSSPSIAQVFADVADDTVRLERASGGARLGGALVAAAYTAWASGNAARAQALMGEALEVVEGSDRIAAYSLLGLLAFSTGDFDRAVEVATRALESPERQDRVTIASLTSRSLAYDELGEHDAAVADAREALAIADRIGSPLMTVTAHGVYASLVAESDPERARAHLREAMDAQETAGTAGVDPSGLLLIMRTATLLDEPVEILQSAVRFFDQQPRAPILVGSACFVLALVVVDHSPADAARLLGVRAMQATAVAREPWSSLYARALRTVDVELGHDEATRLQREGAAMSPRSLVRYARKIADDTLEHLVATRS
jgi:predicted ATPase/class 3 adenylate cyclase